MESINFIDVNCSQNEDDLSEEENVLTEDPLAIKTEPKDELIVKSEEDELDNAANGETETLCSYESESRDSNGSVEEVEDVTRQHRKAEEIIVKPDFRVAQNNPECDQTAKEGLFTGSVNEVSLPSDTTGKKRKLLVIGPFPKQTFECKTTLGSESKKLLYGMLSESKSSPTTSVVKTIESPSLKQTKCSEDVQNETKRFTVPPYGRAGKKSLPPNGSLATVKLAHSNPYTCYEYVCPICNKGYETYKCVATHIKQQHPDKRPGNFDERGVPNKTYTCQLCDKSFGRSWKLSSHVVVHARPCEQRCSICHKTMETAAKLSKHMARHSKEAEGPSTVKTQQKEIKCRLCDKAFSADHERNGHMVAHSREHTHHCDICHRTFRTADKLTWHKVTHAAVPLSKQSHAELLSVRNVSELLEQKSKSENCVNVEVKETLPNAIDSNCLVRANTEKTLQSDRSINNTCTITSEMSSNSQTPVISKTTAQVETKSNTETNSFEAGGMSSMVSCPICCRSVNFVKLVRHMAHHKFGKCNVCDKVFTTRIGLTLHKATHTNGQEYLCEICSKRFTLKRNLDLHLRTHTNLRPFKCNLCDKTYRKNESLQHHKEAKHSGPERKHKCDICEKRFFTKRRCLDHVSKHHLEQNTKCQLCEKVFTNKKMFNSHMWDTHKILGTSANFVI